MPFTLIVQYGNISYTGQIENFSYFFNNIANFVNNSPITADLRQSKTSSQIISKLRKYNNLFTFSKN